MAEIIKNVKIINRFGTLAEWNGDNSVILALGEIGLAQVSVVENGPTGGDYNPPQWLAKIGDGKTAFKNLKWLAAPASDVYSWAKAKDKPTYSAGEITGIDNYIEEYITGEMGISIDTDTQYQIVAGDDEYTYKLQSKTKGGTEWTDVSTVTIPKFDESDLLDAINKKVGSVAAGDASVTIGGTATAPTVAVKLSAVANNALALEDDGLKVVIPNAPEYSIVKAANSGDYAAVYNLTKDGTIVGASINIPKDMVVESGSVVENPEGQPAGTYIKLVLQNVTEPLYINVGNLIEYVTSGSKTGDMVVITVSDDHKVTATITDGTITKNKLETSVQTSLNKADTAVQPADLAELNNASHTHANKELLDSYTQTEANLADAVSKKHSHANADELAKVASGDVEKWNSAVQDVTADADTGLVATKGADNKVTISCAADVVFILDGGTALSDGTSSLKN